MRKHDTAAIYSCSYLVGRHVYVALQHTGWHRINAVFTSPVYSASPCIDSLVLMRAGQLERVLKGCRALQVNRHEPISLTKSFTRTSIYTNSHYQQQTKHKIKSQKARQISGKTAGLDAAINSE